MVKVRRHAGLLRGATVAVSVAVIVAGPSSSLWAATNQTNQPVSEVRLGAPVARSVAAPPAVAALPSVGAAFVPVPTKRIVDTKTGKGATAPVEKHSPLHLDVTGVDRVPTTGVAAVVLEVSALDPSMDGSLTVVPDGSAPHHLVSVSLRRHAPSTELVAVGPGTKRRVTVSIDHGHTDLTVDVIGYDAKPGATGAGASLRTVHPVRILDTSTGLGAPVHPVKAGAPRTVTVLGAGQVPKANVTAVLVDLTATNSSRNGTFTAYPTGSSPPTITSLSTDRHQQQAALAVIRPGRAGKITFAISHGGSDLTVTVIGYEAAFESKEATDTYHPLAGARLLDTTTHVGSHPAKVRANDPIHIPVAGDGGVPTSGAVAAMLSVIVNNASRAATLQVYPDGKHHPVRIPVPRHATGSSAVLLPLGSGGRVDITLSRGRANLAVDVEGYTSPDPPTSPVGDLTATASSDVAIALHWRPTNASNIAAIIVRRRTGSIPPATDTNGAAVTTLTPTAQTTTDHSLKPATTYSYSVFTVDDLGHVSRATTRPTATADRPVAEPVTNLAVDGSTNTTLSLSWTDPAGPGQTGTMIRRMPGIEPPSSPTDGTEVADIDGDAQSYTDDGLGSGGTYSYTVFAQYGAYISPPATVTGMTSGPSGPAPGPISGLDIYSTTAAAHLSWDATTPPSPYQVLIRRAPGSTPPASPTDGTYVTTTAADATSYVDTGLTGGQTYSYSLFTMNDVGAYSAPISATVTIVTGGGPASVCGTITGNEEWSPAAATVYVLSCPVTVADGATLLLDPGTIVKVASDAFLSVEGNLDSNGSASKPVTLTSLEDDSVGGDTNGDGDKTTPAPGDWSGVVESDDSSATALELNRTVIDYAGKNLVPAIESANNTDITDDLVENAAGVCIDVITDPGPAPTIKSNVINGCGNAGIQVNDNMTDAHEIPDVDDNVVDDAQGAAVSVSGDISASKLIDNSGSNDAPTALLVGGDLVSNVALPTAGLPWVFGSADQVPGSVIIDPGVTMSLEQGAVLKVASGAGITVEGSLEAHGTVANPVTITSLKDDSVGGDTDGSHGRGVPAAGDWYGIDTTAVAGDPAPTLDLEHVVVSYSDGIHTAGTTATTLLNDDIEQSQVPPAPTVFEIAAAVTLALDNGGSLDIESTTVDTANGDGLGITQFDDDLTDVATVSNNTVNNVTGTAITIDSPNLVQSHLANDTGNADRTPALELAGQLTGNTTLPTPGLPWVMYRGQSCRYGPPDDYPNCGSGLVVASNATLTLNPGAVLKADPGAPHEAPPVLVVDGTLNGSGSATDPATITSLRDDSVGGDTNGDGSGTMPKGGDWGGVEASSASVVDLRYTTVSYGSTINTDSADSVSLTDDLIEHSGLADTDAPAVSVKFGGAGSVDIEGNTIDDSSGDGIVILEYSAPDDDAPVVKDNVVSDAAGTAIIVNSAELDASKLEGNTGSNDQTTALAVEGTLPSDTTLPVPGLPWVVGTGLDVLSDCSNDCGLVIPPGVTLTLSPGDTLKFGLNEYPTDNTIDVEGALISDGTASDPVTLTSLADDSVGASTDGNGGSTIPRPGDWGGIDPSQPINDPAPSIDLTDTTVRYADTISASGFSQVSHLTMIDCTVSDMAGSGVSAAVNAGGSVDIEGSTISNVASSGITVGDTSTNPADAPTLVNNTISGAAGAAISLTASDIVPAQITGDSGSGDHPDAITADGALVANLSLPVSGGFPWVVGAGAVQPQDTAELTIPPGVQLSLNAGAVLKFAVEREFPNPADAPYLDVEGTLTASGAPSSPATFTSLADDTVGGDTNDDGDGSVGVPGDWAGIVDDPVPNHPAPTIALDNTTITYATTALTVPSGNATVTGTIDDDLAGISGPVAAAGGSCPNGSVNATPVNWGTPSGPAPYGTGPGVTGCVTVQPWVGES